MCMWEYLQEEAVDRPDSAAGAWFADLVETYGEVENFPHLGCGARYYPWKRGASMVCEIQFMNSGGAWEAFLADHTPAKLDDALRS